MTASERMAGLVEAFGDAMRVAGRLDMDQDEARKTHKATSAADALLTAIGELERDRDAQAAEVARLRDDTAAIVTASVAAALGEVVRQGGALGRIVVEAEGAGLREGAWKKTLTAKCYDALAASQAEVARLAGVARDACDVAERVASLLDAQSDMATRRGWSRAGRSDIAAIRSAIPTPDPADDGDCTACGGPSCACVDDATPDPAVFVAAVERIDRMVFDFGLLSTKAAHRSRDASDEADASGTQRPSAATRDAAKESSSAAWDARMAIKAALLALGGVR